MPESTIQTNDREEITRRAAEALRRDFESAAADGSPGEVQIVTRWRDFDSEALAVAEPLLAWLAQRDERRHAEREQYWRGQLDHQIGENLHLVDEVKRLRARVNETG